MARSRAQIAIDFEELEIAAKRKKMTLAQMSEICGRSSSYLSTMGKTGHISREVYEDLKTRLKIDVAAKERVEVPEQMTLAISPSEVTLSPETMRELAKMIAGEIFGMVQEDDRK